MPTKVQFTVRCKDTKVGHHVRVVGSCKALGSWSPKFGVVLDTNAEDFPVWKSDTLQMEIGDDEVIEYKFVICNADGLSERWEECWNRVLQTSVFEPLSVVTPNDMPVSTIIISETFGKIELQEGERFSYCSYTFLSPGGPAVSPYKPSGPSPKIEEETMQEPEPESQHGTPGPSSTRDFPQSYSSRNTRHQIQFSVACRDTRPGTHVRLVGSCKLLGSWSPDFAVMLTTNPSDWPIWRSDILEIGDDDHEARNIEYKYIICRTDGNADRWETGENRTIKPSVLKANSIAIVSEWFDSIDRSDKLRFSYLTEEPHKIWSRSMCEPSWQDVESHSSHEAGPSSNRCRVQFKYLCKDTTMGTHVRLVGSGKALGNWNPKLGIVFHTNPEEFPVWRSDVLDLDLADDEALFYKYVLCDKVGDADRWEECENRIVLPSVFKPSSVVIVMEFFNAPDLPKDQRFSYRFCSRLLDDPSAEPSPRPVNVTPSPRAVSGSSTVQDKPNDGKVFQEFAKVPPVVTPSPRAVSGSSKVQDKPMQATNPYRSRSAFEDIESEADSAAGTREKKTRADTDPADPPPKETKSGSDSSWFQPTLRSRSGSLSRFNTPAQNSRVNSRGNFGKSDGSQSRGAMTPQPPGDQQASQPEAPPAAAEDDEGYAMVREESLSHLSLRQHACEAPEFQAMYHLEGRSPLAEGSFGLVWVCSERGTKEKNLRAVKIVQKPRLRPREFQLLLGEGGEIQTHLRLKHQHIVALYEAFDDLRTVSLVMEYCRGGDLFDAVTANWRAKGRGIEEVDASVAQRHILCALSYLDSQSVAHRDIKCENVLLLHDNVPIQSNVLKLCDFGFATYDDGNGLTDRLGSPDTVAPEVIIGRRYGTKADVWSAGVMLFMMLSARSPFWAPTDDLVLKRVRAAEWSMTGDPWSTVSEAAKACIRSMMTADPAQRPSAKQILQKHVWLSGNQGVAAG